MLPNDFFDDDFFDPENFNEFLMVFEDEFLDDYDLLLEGELSEEDLKALIEQARNRRLQAQLKQKKEFDPVGLIVILGLILLAALCCVPMWFLD